MRVEADTIFPNKTYQKIYFIAYERQIISFLQIHFQSLNSITSEI